MTLEAYRVLGSSLFSMGRMEEAREHFARALALYDWERDHGNLSREDGERSQDTQLEILRFAQDDVNSLCAN
jgi:tetratricopeptide (TPR) repeat protein